MRGREGKRDCEMKGEMEGGRKGRSVVGKMRMIEGGREDIYRDRDVAGDGGRQKE